MFVQLKSDRSVIGVVYKNTLTLSKWKWDGAWCREVLTDKNLSGDIFNSFNEITEHDYNNQWAINLQNA
jgi:hypothetical protein